MQLLISLILTLFLSPVSTAALAIRSDAFWVEDATCPAGWQRLDFDDSGWLPVPYPWTRLWPIDWQVDRDARPIWGTAVRAVNCLRRTFSLTDLPPQRSVLHLWVDDDYDLFVNGIPVGSSRDHHGLLPGESYDVTPLLRRGENVIAVQVRDNGGVMGMLLSLQIPGLPEPARRLGDLLDAALPWFCFVVAVAVSVAAILCLRRVAERLGPTMERVSASGRIAATIVLAGCAQVLFCSASFYRSHRDMPLAEWNWTWIAVICAIFAVLVLVRARPEIKSGSQARVAGEGRWLAGILLLALVLRTYQLDAIPPGFFQDEATNGNDALRLEQSDRVVLWSDSIGGRPTLFLYLLLGALKLFGVSYLSLKVVPVAVGVAGVAALYALARVTFGPRTALWAAFLLAVSRWDIHYSRMAWEAICVPLFASAGFALLASGLRVHSRAPLNILAGAVVLAAGLYTYAAYRAVPAAAAVFVLATLRSFGLEVARRQWLPLTLAAGAALLVAMPLLAFAWREPELYWYRYQEVALTRFIFYYQAPEAWLHQIGKGLLALTSVGDDIVRHNLPGAAHLDPITSALLVIGVATGFSLRNHVGMRLACCWLVVFTALATLTMDGPHATRLLGIAPPVMLFAAFAVTELLAELRRWRPAVVNLVAAGLATGIAAVNVQQYFVAHANHPAADFQYNLTGRSLCEYLRQQEGTVTVHWTSDVGYWAHGQCLFLAGGKYELGDTLQVEDVLPGNRFENVRRPILLVLGAEFLAEHRDVIASDTATGLPLVALPAQPLIGRDRRGHPLYYLYRAGA